MALFRFLLGKPLMPKLSILCCYAKIRKPSRIKSSYNVDKEIQIQLFTVVLKLGHPRLFSIC